MYNNNFLYTREFSKLINDRVILFVMHKMSEQIKPKIVKILLVHYKFTNRTIGSGAIGQYIKNYYENNSRGKLSIQLTRTTVSFNQKYVKNYMQKLVKQAKNKIPKNFDYYMHFCNPSTSRANGKHAVTWASKINAVHELGHLLGLQHSNVERDGKLQRSRDPFSQMTSYASYPSVNAPHRFLKNWYLKGELLEFNGTGKFNLHLIRDFKNTTSIKTLLYRTLADDGVTIKRYFITLVDQNNELRVALHTIYGPSSSILLLNNIVNQTRFYTHELTGLQFKFSDIKNNNVMIEFIESEKVKKENIMTESEDPEKDLEKEIEDQEDQEPNDPENNNGEPVECDCKCHCGLSTTKVYSESDSEEF